MRFAPLSLTALLLTPLALPAQADASKCSAAPKDRWLSADAIKSKAESMGYQVRRVQEEDGCWEVYAITADGKRAEVYLEPTTGTVVAQNIDD